MGERDNRNDRVTRRMNSGRAGCGESRTSGSASGSGNQTALKGQHCAPTRLNVVVIHGERSDAETLRQEVAAVLATVGLVLSETKTTIVHIDEGFDFLGWRIQRHRKRGTAKHFVYTYPSKTSLGKVTAKVKTLSRQGRNEPLSDLLRRLNPVLRGWTNYFRHGVSKATFGDLRAYTWARVLNWLRRKHPRANWKWLRRRYLPEWWPTEGDVSLFNPNAVASTYARYRGQIIDTTPWKPTVQT